MELIEQAFRIAVVAHKDQVRKTDGSPYIIHPLMVANIVRRHGFAETVCAAAVVHDVLEDTEFSEETLRDELGSQVVDIVTAVSEDKTLEWELRKEEYVKAVVAAGEEVWAVSVGDKIHNAQSMLEYYKAVGPDLWSSFNRGKEQKLWFEKMLLKSLESVWQHPILEEYAALVVELEALEG